MVTHVNSGPDTWLPSLHPCPKQPQWMLWGRPETPTIFMNTHGRGSDVCSHVEIWQPQVLWGQGPRLGRSGDTCGKGQGQSRGGGRAHLNLLVLEDAVDATVEGGTREHGRDRVREVQHRLQHRSHALGAMGPAGVKQESLGVTNKWSLGMLIAQAGNWGLGPLAKR